MLVFGPTADEASVARQRESLSGCEAGIRDRDLRVEYSTGADEFAVVLIGRDGGEKLRSAEPVTVEELFGKIDGMPMRRRELRESE